jgi:uncharacterized protein (TIGR04255 family)
MTELTWPLAGDGTSPEARYGTNLEAFYQRLSDALAERGFTRSERQLPVGFPTVPGRAVFRMTEATPMPNIAVAFGAGYFSISATPPYKSWEDFRPQVDNFLPLLLAARPEEEQGQAFSSVSVRYVDAFRDHLRGESSRRAFVDDVLGFTTSVPDAIAGQLAADAPYTVFSQLSGLTRGGFELGISIGEATYDGDPTVILDVSVSSEEVPGSEREVLDTLDAEHEVTHSIFAAMSAPIVDRMREAPNDRNA